MGRLPTAVVDKLLADGIITHSQYSGAMQHFANYGGFIEESLIETGAVTEEVLLKAQAGYCKTRFVITEKLKAADIGMKVLSKISMELARKYTVFPILLDEEKNILSIVAVDPLDLDMEQEICRAGGLSKVRSFVSRPAAIKAAISKFYRGDLHAFASFDKEGIKAFQSMMDVYERNLLDEGDMVAAVASSDTSRRERTLSGDEIDQRDKLVTDTGRFSVVVSKNLSLEIVRVLISLLESSRKDLSGHSVLTANYSETMCVRIGVSKWEAGAITLAALLHDLGKGDPYHLTAFNVAEWDGHHTTAMKRFETPLRLLESADLPLEATRTIRHMYERIDGSGFPDGLNRTEIPLGSRILAITDTFSDLTSNPRNPFRRILSPSEAIEVIKNAKKPVFDSNLLDLFSIVVAGDDIKRQLLTGAKSVLAVDSDAEQCAILEMQLITQGFNVRTARTAEEAIKMLIDNPVDIIVSEVDLKPFDGFEMKKRLNEQEGVKTIPLIYFTSRSASNDVKRGFALGAQDYLLKPSATEVLVAKIHHFLGQAQASETIDGVSGSLKEMSIPDLVQILGHGRKTGRLKLASEGRIGEIHFVNGDIYNAMFEAQLGAEAFFSMLRFKDGRFSLDPGFTAKERMIDMSPEMLLLEGLRRFDEDSR